MSIVAFICVLWMLAELWHGAFGWAAAAVAVGAWALYVHHLEHRSRRPGR